MSESRTIPGVPRVVSREEWNATRAAHLADEKQMTRAMDALAAKRRRLPMTPMRNDYVFTTATGTTTLLELFDHQRQLVIYQFMDVGPADYCPGCTHFNNEIVDLAALQVGGASWATVSDMPIEQIEPYRVTMGWTHTFVSSHGTTFAVDSGCVGGFALSVFLRVDDDVYLTYATGSRGVDRIMFTTNILDLLPWGRQEAWEDSPAGWPQR